MCDRFIAPYNKFTPNTEYHLTTPTGEFIAVFIEYFKDGYSMDDCAWFRVKFRNAGSGVETTKMRFHKFTYSKEWRIRYLV